MQCESLPITENEFSAHWASSAEKQRVILNNYKNFRQTMNLRLMSNAKLAIITYHGEIIAHAGIDHEYNPNYPEFFSFYVSEKFRGLGLGNKLEKFICEYCLERGINKLFLRVNSGSNSELDKYREQKGCFKTIDMPFAFSSLCQGCELYGKQCGKQTYLELDLLLRWLQV